jgi:hypothetical protein
MSLLTFNLQQTRPLNDIWRFGFNTCHVPLWLRDDMQRHLEMGGRELGFRYVRAHNMLSDRMRIMQPGGYDFSLVNQAIDNLLLKGLRPFVELSSMPSELVGGEKSLTSYGFKSTPPQDWNAWYELVRALVENFVGRYGLAEVRQWYFEVWNEPDIAFWNGTQQEYFRLYDLAARAVKEVDTQLRVGGPATSKTAWIDEFLAHIAQPSRGFRPRYAALRFRQHARLSQRFALSRSRARRSEVAKFDDYAPTFQRGAAQSGRGAGGRIPGFLRRMELFGGATCAQSRRVQQRAIYRQNADRVLGVVPGFALLGALRYLRRVRFSLSSRFMAATASSPSTIFANPDFTPAAF